MKLKTARRVVFVMWGIVIVLAFIAALTEGVTSQISICIALTVMITSIAITVRFVRCPHCDRFLRFYNYSKYKYCPHCGEKLDW